MAQLTQVARRITRHVVQIVQYKIANLFSIHSVNVKIHCHRLGEIVLLAAVNTRYAGTCGDVRVRRSIHEHLGGKLIKAALGVEAGRADHAIQPVNTV